MDLNQTKLSKIEWDTTEIPITKDEHEILTLINKGYDNVNIIYNTSNSQCSKIFDIIKFAIKFIS